MPVFNFDLEDGKPPVTFNLKPEDAARFIGFMAQCEGDQKDAARYRWLRATTNHITSKGRRIELASPEELDAAIDRLIDADGVPVTEPRCPKCGLPQSECDFQRDFPDPDVDGVDAPDWRKA